MTRPKGTTKYKTDQQRKAANKLTKSPQIRSRYFRLVIPHLSQIPNTPAALTQLKYDTLQLLLKKQTDLQYYSIAAEHHQDGTPHLDILLIYSRSVLKSLKRFDFLIKHGFLSRYKKLNQSVLDYGSKQDNHPLSNLPQDKSQILQIHDLKRDPYSYLYRKMKWDPLHFNLEQYVQKNQLSQHISNWSSIKTKLKDMQLAAANLTLKNKPGFRLITRQLIQSLLSPSQLTFYDSWSGYQTIVNYLNQIILFKGDRQQKTLNLLITGLPNCGKSALIWQRNPPSDRTSILQSCSVYPMGLSQWFPKYQSDVYHCIYWNQMKLTSYSYDTILKLLDGSPLDLANKGSISRKVDNPLIIMTSNLTLQQMIQQKFFYNQSYLQMARRNIAVRVQNVIVPKGYDLFLLQKLLTMVKSKPI